MTSKEKILEKADQLLSTKHDKELRSLLVHQDFHVIAWVIDGLQQGRRKSFAMLPPEKQAEVALALSDDSKKKIFPRLSDEVISRFLHFCDEDDATDIMQHLSSFRRMNILLPMKEEKRRKIEKLLKFGSETAGGLMDLNFTLVRPEFTFHELIEKVRKHIEGKRDMPTVLVVDEEMRVLGFIPERTLLFPPQKATIEEQMHAVPLVSHKMDREKVMQVMSRMRSDIICVTDEHAHVLGIIHLRDLMKVAQAEATEDMYLFAGVDIEEHALDPTFSKVKRRYNWLILNLFTAFLASFVVKMFQGTIQTHAILAVYMSVVSGSGGNAATQALVVAVRGMSTGELTWNKAWPVIRRESFAGIINGCIIGTCAAAGAIAFGAPPILGLILAVAMIINMYIAGFFGALIPFVLKRFKIDPAIASSVFVTTFTDCFGFGTFLALGKLFL